jgi:glycosyltransferase involved in cell wall biosynthesis
MSTKVSVIVPTYNEEKYLDRCLSTLLDQTYSNFEIIVVDDDSTDSSKEIIQKYPVKYLHQEHSGPALAKNLGAKHASGDILVFADSDFYYDRNYISDLVKPVIAGEAIGTYSKEIYVANPNNKWSRCYNINTGLDYNRKVPKDFPDESEGFRTIFRKDFVRVGGFDNIGYGEDMVFYKKLEIKAKAVGGAKAYHFNPDSVEEFFATAQWVGKGNRFGIIKSVIRLFKYSLPISLLIGIMKATRYRNSLFIVFKTIWDFGVTIGIIKTLFGENHAK